VYRTLAWRLEAGQQAQQRALAAARRTDKHEERAGFDGQVDWAEGGNLVASAPVPMRHIADPDGTGIALVRNVFDVTG
jgi:hypothetical protein